MTAANVTIQHDAAVYHIQAAAYQANVGTDGCLTSFNVQGKEFFTLGPSFPRGAYLFQDGLLKLDKTDQPTANVITARSDKASARFDFGADAVTWTVTNATSLRMLCVIVLDSRVKAVLGRAGHWAKPPVAEPWANTTWFREDASLRMTGGDRIWGPWGDGLQVWEAGVDPHAIRKVVFTADAASPAELARSKEVAASPPPPPPTDPKGSMWDLSTLSKPPATFPCDLVHSEGMQALFYEGLQYDGKPTRVFAWMGIPKVEQGQKVPGIVLVHGGGGTAFSDWVRLWTGRGYAAIAMDTCGCLPLGSYGNWQRLDDGGPPGWGGWDQVDSAREDQWTYQAVADVILANSLLRSQPEVDPDRIGMTGISWGGYLTCIVSGVDQRFRFAVPVYGCGFTNEHGFAGSVEALGKERGARWMRWWDPSVYLPDALMPILWVDGSNDFAYTFNALQKSYRLPRSPHTLAIRLRMPHGHGGPGENPKEIHVFADNILKGGDPLPLITGQGRDGSQVWATFQSKGPVTKAELNVTKDTGHWQDRHWDALPAKIDTAGKATGELPDGTRVYYFNLFDNRDCVVSSEHVELGKSETGRP